MLASWWEVVGELGLFGWGAFVIVGCTLIYGIIRMYKIHLIHRERMAMIEKGIDPGPFIEGAEELKGEEEGDHTPGTEAQQGERATQANA